MDHISGPPCTYHFTNPKNSLLSPHTQRESLPRGLIDKWDLQRRTQINIHWYLNFLWRPHLSITLNINIFMKSFSQRLQTTKTCLSWDLHLRLQISLCWNYPKSWGLNKDSFHDFYKDQPSAALVNLLFLGKVTNGRNHFAFQTRRIVPLRRNRNKRALSLRHFAWQSSHRSVTRDKLQVMMMQPRLWLRVLRLALENRGPRWALVWFRLSTHVSQGNPVLRHSLCTDYGNFTLEMSNLNINLVSFEPNQCSERGHRLCRKSGGIFFSWFSSWAESYFVAAAFLIGSDCAGVRCVDRNEKATPRSRIPDVAQIGTWLEPRSLGPQCPLDQRTSCLDWW